jgi:hypothetical protein
VHSTIVFLIVYTPVELVQIKLQDDTERENKIQKIPSISSDLIKLLLCWCSSNKLFKCTANKKVQFVISKSHKSTGTSRKLYVKQMQHMVPTHTIEMKKTRTTNNEYLYLMLKI